MDEQRQPDLSHLHKKTYARFQAAALQYNFVIQNKAGSGVPLHLRTTSPLKINAMGPSNPKLLQAQNEDPDLHLIKQFRISKHWPSTLHPDHQLKLDDLNRNLLIDHHGAVWVHCPGRGPDVPTLKALYLPLKYRQWLSATSGNGIRTCPSETKCRSFKKIIVGWACERIS